MARRRQRRRLTVALNGRTIGQLDRAPGGAVSFTYDRDWLGDEQRAMAVSLSLPLREEPYRGAVVSAYFDNLLPDNENVRRIVAERVGADGTDAFSLLDRIGRDCVGALQFVPEGEKVVAPSKPSYVRMSQAEVADTIRNLATAPLGVRVDDEYAFRISIAGAQEKTALLWQDGWCQPTGSTPTTHILKPQIGRLANGLDLRTSVQNEHFCLTLCRNLGVETAKTEIVTIEDLSVLAVKRFDRIKSKDGRLLRIPQEDFCQALSIPATRKYTSEGGPGISECMDLLNGSDEPAMDRSVFLKAQVLFWLLGATDGHAKNFSLFLTPNGRYRMTPLYDVMSLQPNYAANQIRRSKFRMAMAIGEHRHYVVEEILPRHFYQNAAKSGVSEQDVDAMFAHVFANFSAAFEDTIQSMPADFPECIVDPIYEGAQRRLQRIEGG